jgi:hypothetical protein
MRSRLGTAYEAGVGGCIYQRLYEMGGCFFTWHSLAGNIHFPSRPFQSMMDGRQRRTGRRADPVPQKYTNDSKFILSTLAFFKFK